MYSSVSFIFYILLYFLIFNICLKYMRAFFSSYFEENRQSCIEPLMKSKSFMTENCCCLPKCRKRVSEEYRPLIRFFPVYIQEEKLLLSRVFHLLSVALSKYLSAGYHYASRELRCMCAQLLSAFKKPRKLYV